MDIIEIATTCRKLAYGFYHRWRFPHVYDEQGREVEEDERRRRVVDTWYAARKAWFRELRDKLTRRSEYMDSFKHVRDAAIRYHQGYKGPLPTWKSEFWPFWAAMRPRVEHVPDTVWIDDYLVRDAAEWARANTGIVWCLHGSFARALAKMTGLPRYGEDGAEVENLNPTPAMLARRDTKIRQGEEWKNRPQDWIEVEDGTRSIVASIKAHGTGRNLQAWHKMLMANLPADGGVWEQTLAREHRRGQPKDVVLCDVYQHLPELVDALSAARGDALYKQKIEGAQRLLYARYDFDPP